MIEIEIHIDLPRWDYRLLYHNDLALFSPLLMTWQVKLARYPDEEQENRYHIQAPLHKEQPTKMDPQIKSRQTRAFTVRWSR